MSLKNKDSIQRTFFSILLEINKLLDTSEFPDEVLYPSLMLISDQLGLEDTTITIFDNKSKEIYIDISYGLSSSQQARGRYQLGEGIIGEVVQTGNKIIVPKISEETKFANKLQRNSTQEFSFICVPIKFHSQVTGALSTTFHYHIENNLLLFSNLLELISRLLAHPIILRRKLMLAQKEIELTKNFAVDSTLDSIIGNSSIIKSLKSQIYEKAKTKQAMFVYGEHGVGKTFLANIIHNINFKYPLIQFNPCSLSKERIIALLFSNLLPHISPDIYSLPEIPLIIKATNNTLLIENLECLDIEIQELLLQIMNEQEVFYNNTVTKLSINYIFTSVYSLEELNDSKKISPKLYAQLKTQSVYIPPLRDRKDDIILLTDKFLQDINAFINQTTENNFIQTTKRLSTPAIDLLTHYHWPGNLNELFKVIEGAVHKSEGPVIHAHMLPPSLQSADSTNTHESLGLLAYVERLEKDLIIDALKTTSGHIANSAKILKISERILGLRIKKYQIEPKSYR